MLWQIIYYILIVLLLLLIACRLKFKTFTRFNNSYTCLMGKTAIVTGANTGIGYYTALDFAMRGARVIMACRNETATNTAKNSIIQATGNADIHVRIVDLSSLSSVRRFCTEIIASEHRIDILVNNAGAGGLGDELTADGLVATMQINYFAPALLTTLLARKVAESNGRIVNVASEAASMNQVIEPKGLNERCEDGMSRVYIEWYLYCKSKICLILYSRELARRLKDVKVYVLHPGAVKTDIYRNIPQPYIDWLLFVLSFIFRNCLEGAQTTIYCSVAKECETQTGLLYDNCKPIEMYESCKNMTLARELWQKTEEILNLSEYEKVE